MPQKVGAAFGCPFLPSTEQINDNYQITELNRSDSRECGSNATLVWQRHVSLKDKLNKLALKNGFR